MARARLERFRSIDLRRDFPERLRPGAGLQVTADGHSTRIELDWTPCHLGGRRPWLVCPFCRRRRVALYAHAALLACRRCLGTRYRSQLQDAPTRLEERAERIERSLGWEDWDRWIPRPKGMWRRTYQRRLAQAHALWDAARALEDEEAWRTGLRLVARWRRQGAPDD
jgi:hypothetical protein